MQHRMVQYSVWSNCPGNCKFCLRAERKTYSKKYQLKALDEIKRNIGTVDWENDFSDGISLLGGELFFITDEKLQESLLDLFQLAIDKVIKVSKNPNCCISTVTNGMYQPDFLYKVVDLIDREVGINHLDINFSYDLKYRYDNDEKRQLVLKNINDFHKKYNYMVGIQMIMTQYLIDMVNNCQFNIEYFLNEEVQGNMLCFLYPHPIKTGEKLNDFFFKRSDFIKFVVMLKNKFPKIYESFVLSTKHSAIYKYTGLQYKFCDLNNQKPVLTDGKEIINEKCGHSKLYQCYSDSDRCMLCDLYAIDGGDILC